MKVWLAIASLLMCAMLLNAGSVSAEVSDAGGPQYANKILGAFETAVVEPGQTARVMFNLTNPYPDEVMVNILLTIGIYMYATQEKSQPVSDGFSHPPLIEGTSTERTMVIVQMEPSKVRPIAVPILTSKDTPHGSYFSQSTYFIRFMISFNFENNDTLVVLKSRGYFSDDEWNTLVSWESGEDIVNRTYLKSLGVDGLLPDTSFGIKIPIPRWPLGVIVVAGAGLCFLGLYYYVLDNPGKHPSLEKRFYYLRGKLSEFRSQAKHRRGK